MGNHVVTKLLESIFVKDSGGATIDPATKQKQDSLIASVDAVFGAVDGLELSVDNIDIDLDDVETALAALQSSNETHSDEEQAAIASLEVAVTAFKTAFDARDLATDTTLSAAKTVLDNILLAVDGLEGNTDELESKLEAIKTKLDTLNATDFATETTQATLLTEVDFDTRTGEVSATPTANTVLGRLKDISDELAAINLDTEDLATESTLSSVLSAVDGVEALLTTISTIDYATEATLAAQPTQAQQTSDLQDIEDAVDELKAQVVSEDFATETTLATLLTEATFNAEDFATQTTLEAARALLATIDADTGNLDTALSTRASEATVATLLTEATFAAEDFATQTTLEAARVLLASLDGKDYATATKQDSIVSELQDIETDVEATNALLTTIDGVLDNLLSKVTELDTAFDAEDFASETTLSNVDATIGDETDLEAASGNGTVVAILKAIRSKLGEIDSNTDALEGVDYATETTLSSLLTKLTELDTAFDAEDFATAANQTTLIGHVDGLEALLTTIDADTGNLAARDFLEPGDLNLDGSSNVGIHDAGGSITVDGPLTDAELRASDVNISLDGETVSIEGKDGSTIADEDNPLPVQTGKGNRTLPAQQPGTLGVSEDFVAPWQEVKHDGGITVVLAYVGTLDVSQIEWSSDGITANGTTTEIKEQDAGGGVNIYVVQTQTLFEYFRVHVTADGSGATAVVSDVAVQDDPPRPSLFTTDTTIGAFDVAMLTRSIITGENVDGLLDPTGTYGNVELINGSIKAAIPWELLLKYATPDDPALPSGANPTIDSVLNTEANTIDTGWLAARAFPGGNFIVVNSNTELDVYLANASDNLGNNSVGLDFVNLTVQPGLPAVISAAFFDDYFRAIVVNKSGSTATELSVRSMGLQAPAPSVVFSVDQEIPGFTPAAVVQSITKGQTPDDTFRALRIQGRSSTNSSTTPLNGNTGGSDHIYRGSWFEWQDSYLGLISECRSDVSGSFILDFSTQEAPVDGDETGVDFSITVPYDPSEGNGTLRRHTPIQSRWVRVRYENGLTAQSEFELDCAFITGSPPDVTEPLTTIPQQDALAGIERVRQFAENSQGTFGFIGRGGVGDGLDSHITGIDSELPIRPLDTIRAGQGTVTSVSAVPIPSAGAGLGNRKTIEYSNHSNTINVYWGPTSAVTASTGKILRPGADVGIEVDDSVDIYWVAEDSGGTTATSDESGSSAGGTATSPSNSLTSNDSRATLTNGQTLTMGSFTYSQTLTDINTLRVGVEGRKSTTPTSQTVSHVETQNGATSGATSVVSDSIVGGSDLLYVVAVARNAANTVSDVSGVGLSFTRIINDVQVSDKRLDVWYAYGDGTTGAVTASMSSSTRANIMVSTFTGADPDSPIEEAGLGATGTGTLATTNTLSKTQNGLFYAAMFHQAASATAGTGFTEPSNGDNTNGTGSNRVSLAVQYKQVSTTGTEAATMNLSTSEIWAIAGVTILPGDTQDITYDVEFDVNGGGYTDAGMDLTFDSTTEETQYIDISGLHPLTQTDINNTTIRLTRTSAGAATGEIDHVFLEVVEGDADSAARISYAEVADSGYP